LSIFCQIRHPNPCSVNNFYEPTDEEFLDMYSSKHQEIDVDEVMVDVIEEVVGFSRFLWRL
jgi:hypothetical protein